MSFSRVIVPLLDYKFITAVGGDGFATIIDAAPALIGRRLGKEARESCYCNKGVLYVINLEERCGTMRQYCRIVDS